MKKTAFWFSMALVLGAFACLLYAPVEAAAGAKHGLSVCAGTIIPALLPFLILSALLNALGLPKLLSRAVGPLMGKLFGVSGAAAVPLLLGLTGGYPVGAAAAADLVKRGELTAEECSQILPFCNNTGPAFIVGAAGCGIFHSSAIGLLLYLCHILAAICVGLLLSGGRQHQTAAKPQTVLEVKTLSDLLPDCVKSAVASTLNICGYVVFFSVITALLDALGVFPAIAGGIAVHLNAELHFVRALLTGILELGSGIGSMAGLTSAPKSLAMAAFVLGFGGLSVHCQTLAAVAGTEVKTARHFAGRLLHGALSALFAFLFFTLLRI